MSHDYFNAGEGKWDWVTMGDLVQNYTRNKDVTTNLNVGTNLTNTTTVGNDYEDHLTVTGNKSIHLTNTGNVSYEKKTDGNASTNTETKGNVEENYMRHQNLTINSEVGDTLTKTTTVGQDYVDNFTVNGNITENSTIIGDVTKTVDQSGTTVLSYKNNNELVKTVSSKIDANDIERNIIGVQNSEIIERGEIIYKRVKGDLVKHEYVDTYTQTLTIINGAEEDGTMETYKYKKVTLNRGETLYVLCLVPPLTRP